MLKNFSAHTNARVRQCVLSQHSIRPLGAHILPCLWPQSQGTLLDYQDVTSERVSPSAISSGWMSEARHRRIKAGDFTKLLRIFFLLRAPGMPTWSTMPSHLSEYTDTGVPVKSRECGHVILLLNGTNSKYHLCRWL